MPEATIEFKAPFINQIKTINHIWSHPFLYTIYVYVELINLLTCLSCESQAEINRCNWENTFLHFCLTRAYAVVPTSSIDSIMSSNSLSRSPFKKFSHTQTHLHSTTGLLVTCNKWRVQSENLRLFKISAPEDMWDQTKWRLNLYWKKQWHIVLIPVRI